MQQAVSPVSGGQQGYGANEGPTGSQGDGFTFHMVIDYSTTIPPISLNVVTNQLSTRNNAVIVESKAHTGVAILAERNGTRMCLTPYMPTNDNEVVNGVHTDLAEGTSADSIVNRAISVVKDGKKVKNLVQSLLFGENYGSTIDAGDWETMNGLRVLDDLVFKAISGHIELIKVPSRAKLSVNQTISGLKFIVEGLLSPKSFKSNKEWIARNITSVDEGDEWDWETTDFGEAVISLSQAQANELGMSKGKTTVGEVLDQASSLMSWTPYGESDGTEQGTNPMAGLKSAKN